ncbi:hypothetical protein [Halocatena pleomorpha]|uniref:Uncharacterized protein n=1 Tax=Halocatena pleomorpha TaxID=1785090 RepID=A0A3P3RCU8_9EURY|nr:hypothetical protein [Halocatena pleomorpha]RRJ31154.1 hypothetical protein EIK79_07930 [Halocatena pleomorpha]
MGRSHPNDDGHRDDAGPAAARTGRRSPAHRVDDRRSLSILSNVVRDDDPPLRAVSLDTRCFSEQRTLLVDLPATTLGDL